MHFIYVKDYETIYIPKPLLKLKTLNANDVVIMTVIGSECVFNDVCRLTNAEISAYTTLSERTVSRCIAKLLRLGYIEFISFNGRKRVVKVTNLLYNECAKLEEM